MWHYLKGAYENQQLKLSFNRKEFLPANHVLIFAYYHGSLLFTKHKTRGWELPGGKCHSNESPTAAAKREIYEETGAEINEIKLIGQYMLEEPNKLTIVKNIYLAKIIQIHPLPQGFETEATQLFTIPPAPEDLIHDAKFSPIVKDDVYRLTLQVIDRKYKWSRQ